MDTLLTTGRVADRLGTTRSRVHRAVTQGVVRPETTAGGHLRFRAVDVALLERQLGYAPPIAGISREEVLVAAALLGRPLGLRSARAVARAAGISPTTASRALRRLEKKELVRRRRRRVVLGVPRDVDVWEIDVRNRRWGRLAPMLADAVFPETSEPAAGDGRVPVWLRHLFWNADVHQLDVRRDGAYIAGRILASDDAQAHAWAVVTLPAEAFLHAARMRGVPRRRAALARNLAAGR
ncbi:MAG: MarR family transcriptional regulator [Acidimicrobiia bacterium]|nr:MarR family transcriptional regulator [Acidimicrobiia bacterium]MDH3469695.1 MarR family transcriptional regulator [Acidimicrobiia bacterium]